MTKKTSATAKNAARRPSRRAISWTTEIAHTRHHWWWYLVIIWAGSVLSILLYTVDNLTASILAAVAAVSLIVINIGNPRKWKVTVGAKSIRIQRPDRPKFTYDLPLNRYKSFTVVDMPAGKRDTSQRAIALLPHRRLQPAQLLVLPHDTYEADSLVQQFSDYLPYERAEAFTAADRLLTGIAGWAGIR